MNNHGFVLLCTFLKLLCQIITYLLIIIKYFDAMSSICIFSRFHNPPAVFGACILESLEFFMALQIFHCDMHWNINDVCFWHNFEWVLETDFSCVLENVFCKLTLRGYLVDAIDVIVNLMRQKVLKDLDSPYLSKYYVW